MRLTWDQLCIVGIGAFAFVGLIFGFALVSRDALSDPDAGQQFDLIDPCDEDFAAWADVIQLHHRTTTQNGPDRAA